VILCITTALYWTALYCYVPILAPYVEHQGGTLTVVGFVVSAYGLAQLLLRLPLGVMSDWTGRRKPFLAVGLLAALVASLVFLLAPSPWFMIGARFIAGISACAWVAFTVLFARYFRPGETAQAMGYISCCNSLAIMGATLAGGYLADAFGWRAPFWGAAGIAGVGLFSLAFVYEPPPCAPPDRHFSPRLRAVVCSRELLLVSLIAALGQWGVYATTFGFVPTYAVSIGATRTQLGLLITLSTLSGSLAALLSSIAVIRRCGTPLAIAAGHLSIAAATAVVPAIDTMVPLYLSQVLVGFGRGLTQPLLLNLAIARFSDGEKATAMGFFQAVYAIGMFAGPMSAGLIGSRAGYPGLFLCTAAVALLTAGIAMRLRRQRSCSVPV
jgi:predicted MFS family arabinose efflux permease